MLLDLDTKKNVPLISVHWEKASNLSRDWAQNNQLYIENTDYRENYQVDRLPFDFRIDQDWSRA